MRKLIFAITLLLSLGAAAQSSDSLVGNWKFKEIYSSENKTTGQENLAIIFKDLVLTLKIANQYEAFFLSREEGIWQFDPELREITLISEKGEEKIKVLQLSPSNLSVELKTGKRLILQRDFIQ